MSEYYVAGGTLHPESACYVERDADRDLFENLLKGEFCYVLTSRQMGKSSLMARTAWKLRKRGFEVVMIDLTAVGQNVNCEQWYDGLIMQVAEQLDLEDEVEDFWKAQGRLSSIQRFVRTLTHVVLESTTHNLIIFIDEIDVVQSLPFSADELFGAISECYNRRTREPKFQRLDFCLLGVASPADLVNNANLSPFNSGTAIVLRDFNLEETENLAEGLNDEKGLLWNVSHQIFHWTQGHPYLTLRLYRSLSSLPTLQGVEDVDVQCEQSFLKSSCIQTDANLLFVNQWLLRSQVPEIRRQLLDLVRDLGVGKKIDYDEREPIHSQLLFSGICILKKGELVVRNAIYRQAFGKSWIRMHYPKAELYSSPVKQSPSSSGKLMQQAGVKFVAAVLILFVGWFFTKTFILDLPEQEAAVQHSSNDGPGLAVMEDITNDSVISSPEVSIESNPSNAPAGSVPSEIEKMTLARSIWNLGGIMDSQAGFLDGSFTGKTFPGEITGVYFTDKEVLPPAGKFSKVPFGHLIKAANFNGSPFSATYLSSITTWTNLTELGLDFGSMDARGLEYLKHFPNLGGLGIGNPDVEKNSIIATNVPLLYHLSLSNSLITPLLLKPLGQSESLSHINFFGFRFQGCGFEVLKDISSLESVRFANSHGQYLPPLSKLQSTNIRHLDLQFLPIRRQDFIELSELKKLRQLDLAAIDNLNPSDLLLLQNSSLEKMVLYGIRIPDAIRKELSKTMEVNFQN